jgi:AraC-like DNA-binding protein
VDEVSPVVLRHPEQADRPFRVARAAPSAPLADVVDSFWSVEWSLPPGGVRHQEVVTHPCANVTVEDGVGWVQGLLTRRFRRRLSGSGRVVGAKLRPAGLSALSSVPPAALVDRRVPAADVLGDLAGLAAVGGEPDAASGMAAFDRWLAARGPRRPAGAELVDEAVELAAADPELTRVDELASRLGVTARTLQRRFDRHLGVGPKWVLQRCRIQDALAGIESGAGGDWAGLAARLGFADQAHFVNTFTAVVGVPPGEYRKRAPLETSPPHGG